MLGSTRSTTCSTTSWPSLRTRRTPHGDHEGEHEASLWLRGGSLLCCAKFQLDHKMKHYKFFVILDDMKTPINWAKNWLAQHIENTGHQYRGRLQGPDSNLFSGAPWFHHHWLGTDETLEIYNYLYFFFQNSIFLYLAIKKVMNNLSSYY